jgi:anti-sigma factor ChrR (cupin superfamily)
MVRTKSASQSLLPDDIASELLVALTPISMPKKREAKLKDALMKKVAATQAAANAASRDIATVRADAGGWYPWLPGIDAKMLYDDGHRMSWLARFQPGARMAAHDHDGDEESIVVQGACYVGKTLLKQGDFQLARHGSRHAEIFSPEGCVLLMRTPSLTPAQIASRTAALRV